MKFVHITAALEVGGAGLMFHRLLLAQRAHGEPPATVVSLHHGREGVRRAGDASANVIRETGPR